MLGAANSAAAYEVLRGAEARQHCPYCQCNVAPAWEHLAWECSSSLLSTGRPAMPLDDLQRRLGWPMDSGSAYDYDVVRRLARVRSCVREDM